MTTNVKPAGMNQVIAFTKGARIRIQAQPNVRYKFVDDVSGKTPEDAEAHRQGNDLIIVSKENDAVAVVENFWSECAPGNQCYAVVDLPNAMGETVITQDGPVIDSLLAGQIGQLSEGAAATAAGLGASVVTGTGSFLPFGLMALLGGSILAGQYIADRHDDDDDDGRHTHTHPQQTTDRPTGVAISSDRQRFSGKTEPGANIRAYDSDGNQIGYAHADNEGNFTGYFQRSLKPNEKVSITSQGSGKNPSVAETITAPDDNGGNADVPPLKPTDVAVDQNDGKTVTGKTDPGAHVVVKDKEGNKIGEGDANGDGDFSIGLKPAAIDGKPVTVVAEKDGKTSAPTTAQTADKTPPEKPGVEINDGKVEVTTEPGATVVVKDKGGNKIGEGTADEHGKATVTPNELPPGSKITVEVTDQAGNKTTLKDQDVPNAGGEDHTPPVVDSAEFVDGKVLVKVKEKDVRIKVYDKETNKEIDGDVSAPEAEGKLFVYTFTPTKPFDHDGQELQATATDQAKNESKRADVTVDLTAPKIDSVDFVDGNVVVTTEPGATVVVKDKGGNKLGEGKADDHGKATITPNELPPGSKVTIEVSDKAKNKHTEDKDVPNAGGEDTTPPVIDSAEFVDKKVVVKVKEKDVRIKVYDKETNKEIDGNVSGPEADGGLFVYTFTPQKAFDKDGQKLQATATDKAKNESERANVTVDITAPDVSAEFVGGKVLVTVGEKDASVKVYDKATNKEIDGTFSAPEEVDGKFVYTFTPKDKFHDGQKLLATATDKAQNKSEADVTVDLTPPKIASVEFVDKDGHSIESKLSDLKITNDQKAQVKVTLDKELQPGEQLELNVSRYSVDPNEKEKAIAKLEEKQVFLDVTGKTYENTITELFGVDSINTIGEQYSVEARIVKKEDHSAISTEPKENKVILDTILERPAVKELSFNALNRDIVKSIELIGEPGAKYKLHIKEIKGPKKFEQEITSNEKNGEVKFDIDKDTGWKLNEQDKYDSTIEITDRAGNTKIQKLTIMNNIREELSVDKGPKYSELNKETGTRETNKGNNYFTIDNENGSFIIVHNQGIINGAKVKAGNGDDTIIVKNDIGNETLPSVVDIDLGGGNNQLILGKANAAGTKSIRAGSGNNVIRARTNLDTVDIALGVEIDNKGNIKSLTNAGDNLIQTGDSKTNDGYLNGKSIIYTGNGNDTLLVGTNIDGGGVNLSRENKTMIINLGDGNNTIVAGYNKGNGGYIREADIKCGSGNDSIEVYKSIGKNAVIDLGSGDNTIKGFGDNSSIQDGAEIKFGEGNDTIELSGAFGNSIGVGTGTTTTVEFGDGNNSLTANTIGHAAGFDAKITMGSGADHIRIEKLTGGAGKVDINFKGGDDELVAYGSDGTDLLMNTKIDFGDGYDKFIFSGKETSQKKFDFKDVSNLEQFVDKSTAGVEITVGASDVNGGHGGEIYIDGSQKTSVKFNDLFKLVKQNVAGHKDGGTEGVEYNAYEYTDGSNVTSTIYIDNHISQIL